MPPRSKNLPSGSSVHAGLWAGHADDDAGAGQVAAEDRLQGRVRAPDGLERVVHAVAAGDRLDRLDRVALGRVDGVGGAELARPLQFARIDIDADDRRRAGQATAHDHRVADAAAAEDRHRAARLHPGRIERRADAGHHAAADQTHLLRRQCRIIGNALLAMDEGVGAEGADTEDRRERDAVHRAHALLGVQAGGAEMGLTDPAEAALAAGRTPGQDDMIARRDVGDALADLLHDARALVAEQEGKPLGPKDAVLDGEIGVTDPAGQDAHQRFTRSRRVDGELLDHTGLPRFAGDDTAGHDRPVVVACRRFRHGAAPYLISRCD